MQNLFSYSSSSIPSSLNNYTSSNSTVDIHLNILHSTTYKILQFPQTLPHPPSSNDQQLQTSTSILRIPSQTFVLININIRIQTSTTLLYYSRTREDKLEAKSQETQKPPVPRSIDSRHSVMACLVAPNRVTISVPRGGKRRGRGRALSNVGKS